MLIVNKTLLAEQRIYKYINNVDNNICTSATMVRAQMQQQCMYKCDENKAPKCKIAKLYNAPAQTKCR